jgi:sulfofructose kinase
MELDLIALGRACIDETLLIPDTFQENNKFPILDQRVSGGGQAATSALIVSLLGGKSAYAGVLGTDPRGEQIYKEFEEFGVDTRWIVRDSSYKTPRAVILVHSGSGERTILYEPGEGDRRWEIPAEALKSSKVWILDPQITESELDTLLSLKPKETILVYDAERKRPSLPRMMEAADFFIASETILDLDPDMDRVSQLALLYKEKVKGELVITCGAKGAFWYQQSGTVTHIPALNNMGVVDTTGAGDVFHASFAYYYPRLGCVKSALVKASVCAGISVSKIGTRHADMFCQNNIELLSKQIQPEDLAYEVAAGIVAE